MTVLRRILTAVTIAVSTTGSSGAYSDEADVAVIRAMVEQSAHSLGAFHALIEYRQESFRPGSRELREFKGAIEWNADSEYQWADGTSVRMHEDDYVHKRDPQPVQWRFARRGKAGLIHVSSGKGAPPGTSGTLLLFEDTSCHQWDIETLHLNHRAMWFSTSQGHLLSWDRVLGESSVTPNGVEFSREISWDAGDPALRLTFSYGEVLEAKWSMAHGGNIGSVISRFPKTSRLSAHTVRSTYEWKQTTSGLWYPASVRMEDTADEGTLLRRTTISVTRAHKLTNPRVVGDITIRSFGSPEPGTVVRTFDSMCVPSLMTWRADGKVTLEQRLLEAAKSATEKGFGANGRQEQ